MAVISHDVSLHYFGFFFYEQEEMKKCSLWTQQSLFCIISSRINYFWILIHSKGFLALTDPNLFSTIQFFKSEKSIDFMSKASECKNWRLWHFTPVHIPLLTDWISYGKKLSHLITSPTNQVQHLHETSSTSTQMHLQNSLSILCFSFLCLVLFCRRLKKRPDLGSCILAQAIERAESTSFCPGCMGCHPKQGSTGIISFPDEPVEAMND